MEADIDGPAADSGAENDDKAPADIPLLPNGLTMAGLQHVIHNLCDDVHQNLEHWAIFSKELKGLESFLRVEARRRFS